MFERGTYTACEPCKEHPERPPLWQVKAAGSSTTTASRRSITRTPRWRSSGMPVAYMPYFWTPDPTVKRKTGFLAPRYVTSNTLGTGASLPFFWAIAPNYDLTLTPTYSEPPGRSRPGRVAASPRDRLLQHPRSRHRPAGHRKPSSPARTAPGDRDDRGSLESTGLFYINERWRWGWDVALLSDKWFLENYRIRSESLAHDLLQGIDLDRLSAGPGRPLLVRRARAIISRGCRPATGRSSSRSSIRCSTTTSASTARRRSAARSRST